jgi:hypothetical protein
MKTIYPAPDKVLPIVAEIHRTLSEECEPGIRVEVDTRYSPVKAWFRVEKDPRQERDGILRVSGSLDRYQYKLYINPVSACFEMEDSRAVIGEECFYQFIRMMAIYRRSRRLSPLDTTLISGLVIADSPPVTVENYREAPPDEGINEFAALINEYFYRHSFSEWHGRCCYFICRNPCELLLPRNMVPVYSQLIKNFQSAYPSKQVCLFAVRWTTTQRLFFITEEGRFYHCTADHGLKFLKENLNFLFRLISLSPLKAQTPWSALIKLPGGILLPPVPPGFSGIPGLSGSSFRFTL